VKLIQRLYEVTEGRIVIDGQNVAHATQTSLRSQIAIVQQEPILFHRSLAETSHTLALKPRRRRSSVRRAWPMRTSLSRGCRAGTRRWSASVA